MTKQEALDKIEELKKFVEQEEQEKSKITDIGDCFIIQRESGITMEDLHKKYPQYFYSIDWYENEDFFTTEKTTAGTFIISKKLIPETLNKNFEQQTEILKALNSERRTAVEVMYDLIQYHQKTGKYLFGSEYEWTKSQASSGWLVFVGSFPSVGACVFRPAPVFSNAPLGVAFSRSLELN
jgi:hypothetical protein